MSSEQGKAPQPLDYEAPSKKRLLAEDPFSLLGFLGLIIGFCSPFALFVWDEWTDRIVRAPLLWYQHEWWVVVAGIGLTAFVCQFIKTKFAYGFVIGAGIALLILGANRWYNAVHFGVNPLGRLTHYWIH